MELVDKFDGWIVWNPALFQEAIEQLPPEKRLLKVISAETGIPVGMLSQYLNNKTTPSLGNFKKLCLYCQISSDIVLGIQVNFQ